MQDANVRIWARESNVPVELLDSVRELNLRFLDLFVNQPMEWNSAPLAGLRFAVSDLWAPLSAEQKRAAADCPYALFDLRFDDEVYWCEKLQPANRWRVADASCGDEGTLSFVRLALFFAWHVASTGQFAAQLLLGMPETISAAFRCATIDFMQVLAESEAVHLTARWSTCTSYWSALAGAAGQPDSAALRRIQLYGLQLAAATRLA